MEIPTPPESLGVGVGGDIVDGDEVVDGQYVVHDPP